MTEQRQRTADFNRRPLTDEKEKTDSPDLAMFFHISSVRYAALTVDYEVKTSVFSAYSTTYHYHHELKSQPFNLMLWGRLFRTKFRRDGILVIMAAAG